MTTDEFANKMREIAAKTGDKETAHGEADDLLCKLLTDLGYGEGVKIFDDMDKWYA